MVSEEALRATGLLQPGSLVRWHYRVRLADGTSDAALAAITTTAGARFPQAGWDIRTRTNASPALERNVESFTQYLTLVGLTALLVGGVGVANAVRAHLDRRRDDIATMKALGATGGGVFAIYLAQTTALAVIGTIPGLLVAAALPFLIAWGFGAVIPLPLAPALYPADLALALLYGMFTALAFALWPLGRVHDVSVSALFRDEIAPDRRWPRRAYVVATGLVVAALAALAIMLAYDKRIAAIFVASAAGVFLALRLVAALVMGLARRAPRPRSTALRMALANIHRPGALTTSVVLSLGLGLTLLVTVIEIDGNLRRQFMAALPDKAPSFFFLDIQSAEADAFEAFIHAQAPRAALEQVPMLRGRIMAANDIPADDLKPSPNAAWVLQSDRGITYANDVPAGSRVVEGQWWPPDYQGPPLVSFERKIAQGLGLKLGDAVTVNVLGRNITARVANLRTLDWQSLGINFVMVFSPFELPRRAGQPHRHADLSARRLDRRGGRADQGGGGQIPGRDVGARARRARRRRRPRDQPGARHPRRQRAHARDRRAGAWRRACSRPPPPCLRCGRAQDARRHARAASVCLWDRIRPDRTRDRRPWRRCRLGRRRHGACPGDEPELRLAGLAGAGGRGRRGRSHGCARSPRHVVRARPEAGACPAGALTDHEIASDRRFARLRERRSNVSHCSLHAPSICMGAKCRGEQKRRFPRH